MRGLTPRFDKRECILHSIIYLEGIVPENLADYVTYWYCRASLATKRPRVEALPIHDDTRGAFMTHPCHTKRGYWSVGICWFSRHYRYPLTRAHSGSSKAKCCFHRGSIPHLPG